MFIPRFERILFVEQVLVQTCNIICQVAASIAEFKNQSNRIRLLMEQDTHLTDLTFNVVEKNSKR
jgi:hypothetical protein